LQRAFEASPFGNKSGCVLYHCTPTMTQPIWDELKDWVTGNDNEIISVN
jgi:hypothetical protein